MIPSILPPSRPATTLPAPPPPSLDSLRAAARERLDEAILDREAEEPVLPAGFASPCADCGAPRLSATETLCPECEAAREIALALDGPPALLTSWGSAERWRRVTR